MTKIYIDMDGTLTSYNREDYHPTNPHNWINNPSILCKEPIIKEIPHDWIILSRVSTEDEAHLKYLWARKHFPNNLIITTFNNKTEVVNPKDSILLDDYNKNLDEWQQAGGYSIKVLNTINSPRPDMMCIPQPISITNELVEQDDHSFAMCFTLYTPSSMECHKLYLRKEDKHDLKS